MPTATDVIISTISANTAVTKFAAVLCVCVCVFTGVSVALALLIASAVASSTSAIQATGGDVYVDDNRDTSATTTAWFVLCFFFLSHLLRVWRCLT